MTTPAHSETPGALLPAPDLLHSLELFVDGPSLWGHSGPANKPGVFVVEMPAPQPLVSIDAGAIRGWLERVPDLRLDGRRPTVAELQARLASFWVPAQTVLYIGSSAKSIAARLSGMYKTELGDRRPQSAGYWLKTLHDLPRTRIWWAETDDAELYEDAALDAFQKATGSLPFAVLVTPSGVRREHGITAPLRADEPDAPHAPAQSAAERRSRELANARSARLGIRRSALGGSEPDEAAARRAAARAPARAKAAATPKPAAASSGPPAPAPTYLSADGLAQLQVELEELTTHRRPEVIARIKAARELGDLSENADYEAARKEQSFLEGRVQQLEQLIKTAALIDESQLGHVVVMGSTVVVDSVSHGEETFMIVGSIEADAAAGKISYTSPIGRALMGKRAGEKVRIQAPAGITEYTIVQVR